MQGLADWALLRHTCYINGGWVESDKTIAVDNPATGEGFCRKL